MIPPEIPKGSLDEVGRAAKELGKDILETGKRIGRRVLRKVEAETEILLQKTEGLMGRSSAKEVIGLPDRVKRTVDVRKSTIPREAVKLEEVKVPARPFPVTPHGTEIRALLEKYAEVRDPRFFDEIGRFVTKEEIPTFLEILRHDPRSILKGVAAAKLKQLGAQEAVPDLIRALKNSSPLDNDLSYWVTQALVALDKKNASVPALVEALEHSLKLEPEEAVEAMAADLVRGDLINALGSFRDKRALPVLKQVLAGGESIGKTSQTFALQALANIGGEEAFAALKKALLTQHLPEAAPVLLHLKHKQSVDVLMQALRTGPVDVQRAAGEQLAELARRDPDGPVAKFLQEWMQNSKTPAEVKKAISAKLRPQPMLIPYLER